MIFLEHQQVWGIKERDHSDLHFIHFHPSVLACLGLFQITKEYFWTVKPLKVGLGWDGWTSNLSADNIYASLKGGSMGSLELADLRNPTQDMQRFLSQWRRWYWLSCMYVYVYVCIWKNGTMWEFYSIWYSHLLSGVLHRCRWWWLGQRIGVNWSEWWSQLMMTLITTDD